jgi:protein-S-isoprenylcysteine O-methyltransferase Ste14
MPGADRASGRRCLYHPPVAPGWGGGAFSLAIQLHKLLPHDGPALAVGLIVAAYWFRVVRMAARQRRRTGRAANFIPTEPLGRGLRLIWQPVVWVWVGVPLYLAFAARPYWLVRPVWSQPWAQWMAVATVVAAYVATRVCWRRMGRSWRMGIDPGERTTLVVRGPYAYVRHPIYALSSLMMLATMMAVPSPPLALAGLVHLLLLQWEARREELHLVSVHGSAYEQYRAGVGRFVPRFGGRHRDRYAAAPSAS